MRVDGPLPSKVGAKREYGAGSPHSVAVPATVSGELSADSHWVLPGRRPESSDPRARRPAVATEILQRLAGVPGKENAI